MATENTFENKARKIVKDAEQLTIDAITLFADIASSLAENPSQNIDPGQVAESFEPQIDSYEEATGNWVDEELSDAYLQGIEDAGDAEVVNDFRDLSILAGSVVTVGEISSKAKEVLEDYPDHWTAYRAFQQEANNAFQRSRAPIVRDVRDKVRNLVIEASDDAYLNADTLTRRDLSQRIVNRFAGEGVTGIRYENGRTMKVDSYAEMVARTQTKNAWNEAHMNRMQEQGRDLIVISVHFPCSDLCLPYQGEVFSITGDSEEYPSVQSAIDGGLYHPNCKHSQSPYTGTKPDQNISDERNMEMYKAQQKQRYNERGVRYWKRREAGAITEDEAQKATSKVSEWQSKQRDHLDSNDFLRRQYQRESV